MERVVAALIVIVALVFVGIANACGPGSKSARLTARRCPKLSLGATRPARRGKTRTLAGKGMLDAAIADAEGALQADVAKERAPRVRRLPSGDRSLYGADDKVATKAAVAIIAGEDQDPVALERRFSEKGDVRQDYAIQRRFRNSSDATAPSPS